MSSEVAGYFERLRTHLRLGDTAESDDVMRELATHVEDRVDELVRRGMSPQEAAETTLRGFGRPRTLAHLLRQAHLTTSWADALLGASAFAFVALMVGGALWRVPAFAACGAALVVGITLYGLWQGRPSWFYPWAGAALTLPIAAGYIAFAVLDRGLPELTHANPLTLAGVAGALLYFPVGLFVVSVAILVAVRRDWLDASVLISPLPAMLVAVISIHRAGGLSASGHALADASPLLFGVYFSMALATFALLRAPTRNLRIATLVGSALGLLAVCTLLQDPGGGGVTLAARGALLVGFLLSPALVARHA